MKAFKVLPLFFFALPFAAKGNVDVVTKQASTIAFEFAGAYDSVVCSQRPDPSQTLKLKEALPEWEATWVTLGAPLLEETTRFLNRSLHNPYVVASFTLCPDFKPLGVSHPLIFNAAVFLDRDPTGENREVFVSVVFHEILHRLLEDHYAKISDPSSPDATELIQKYKIEDEFVVSHLHLFALQKEIYHRKGLDAEWDKIETWMLGGPNPSYKRALEIVKTEGAEKFLRELKPAKQD